MRLAAVFLMLAACGASASPFGDDDDGDDVGGDDDGGDDDGGDDDGGDDDGGDDAPGDDPDASPPGVCTDGLGAWTGHDNVPASQSPPCGLSPGQVPQLVSIGFDDNAYSGLEGSAGTGGMSWATAMAAERDIKLSFYFTSVYGDTWSSESPTFVKRAWRAAMMAGHEVGNHTRTHSHGAAYTQEQWTAEITACNNFLKLPFDPNEVNHTPDATKGIGATDAQLVGFRTPFLEYNDATLSTAKALGFRYDTSIEDGYQYDHDGTNYNWPYTLDNGSPGHEILVEWGLKQPISPHPGLWELPVHPVIVPPELRATMKARQSWFDEESGKITGFDYNLWVSFSMTKEEFLATLKYTLDQRLAGNRAPFMFGAHTDYYSSKYTAVPNANLQQRQEAIEEFLDYALSKQAVRVVSNAEILEWVRNPEPL